MNAFKQIADGARLQDRKGESASDLFGIEYATFARWDWSCTTEHPWHNPVAYDIALGPNLMLWTGTRHDLMLTIKEDA